jgi:hypothetical protein
MPRQSPIRILGGTRKGASRRAFISGTSTGTLFYSRDAGDSRHVLAEHLPPIYGVSATLR